MRENLVSCIIPVYNTEKYLEKCLESVIKQTYQNLEIIIIDDGSTDSSPLICDLWKKKDDRILVIHKENGGQSSARNVGLDMMTGEWVVFIDSDDYVHPQFVELLLMSAKKNNVKLATCFFKDVEERDYIDFENLELNDSGIKYVDIAKCSIYSMLNDISTLCWNKICHYSVVQTFRFEIGKIHEDVGLFFYLLKTVKTYSIANHILYYYQFNNASTMRKKHTIEHMDGIDIIYKYYTLFLLDNQKEGAAHILEYCINLFPVDYVKFVENGIFDNIEHKNKFFDKYKEILNVALKNKEIGWKLKLKHLIFFKAPFTMLYFKKNRN